MHNYVIKNSQGWYWPKFDGGQNGTNNEGVGSCWHGLTSHGHIPESVANYVSEKKVIVQAGGNCGFYVKKYAQLFELVYTFEPEPVNFYCLNLNVTEPNVIKFQACVGNEHVGVALGNFMPDVGATHVAGKGVIPTMLIDDLGLERCDLIHLDVEGYELNALKGAENTIKKCHPVIALEYYETWAQRYNTTLNDIESYLATLGYDFFEDVPNAQGDRIYKFKEVAKLPKIYDCFPFFKELDVLELRLEELYDTVDYFVIAEATSTHSGLDKPLYLKDNWDRFAKYHDKIRYIVVDDMPKHANPWVDENYQRNCLAKGFADAQPNDLILISDCDEIARPEVLNAVKLDENDYDTYVLNVALFYYRLNFLKINPIGSHKQPNIVVSRKRSIGTPQAARDLTFKHPSSFPGGVYPENYSDDKMCVIEHGGWHFTFFGDTAFVRSKIKSFAHYIETDQPQYMDNLSVEYNIKNKCALVGPSGEEKFEYVIVDEYFPKTVLSNLEKYKDMIIPNATASVIDFYR
jgi:FkbM family methyltransferase